MVGSSKKEKFRIRSFAIGNWVRLARALNKVSSAIIRKPKPRCSRSDTRNAQTKEIVVELESGGSSDKAK